jgi:uncharacterized glyoxalase superfamily protein PhnB
VGIVLKTVGIVVKDMRKTLDFYRVLGVPIPEDIILDANVDVETEEGITFGFLIEDLAREADPGFVTPVGQSLNLQFGCGSVAEVDAAYARVTGAGYRGYAAPWDAFWGQRFARVVDPDGRVVNLYADL